MECGAGADARGIELLGRERELELLRIATGGDVVDGLRVVLPPRCAPLPPTANRLLDLLAATTVTLGPSMPAASATTAAARGIRRA